MRICAVAMLLGRELARQGHEVLSLWPDSPLFDLRAECARQGFEPELIVQEERLAGRVFLEGLPYFLCPKVFWSLDTHLNWHWQRHYVRLFDGLLTPHLDLLAKLPPVEASGDSLTAPVAVPVAGRMAMFAPARPWRPHAQRSRAVSFVGRITPQRPVRQWLAEFLSRGWGAALAQDLPFDAMADLYCDTRLAPNESLLGEVNFRLMEAAGCGCLVLGQNVGPDQDALFAPGVEIETCADALELREKLDRALAEPDRAEAMARAAWERVRREHLIEHRCRALVEFAAGLPRRAATGERARVAFTLGLAHLGRAGMGATPADVLSQALARLPHEAEVLAARIALAVEECVEANAAENPAENAAGGCGEALALLYMILAEELLPESLAVNLAGSMAGILLGDMALARQFWARGAHRRELPIDPVRLCLLWAGELAQAGLSASAGFAYDPARHLPRAAVECLHLARRLAPDDVEVIRRLAALTGTLRGGDYLRLGHLSQLALRARQDWRAGLALGLANLRVYRVADGLEELANARASALAQGKGEAFLRALAAQEPSGRALIALKGLRRG